MNTTGARLITVIALVAIIGSHAQDLILDVALVINTRPYAPYQQTGGSWESAELASLNVNTDGLSKFVRSFAVIANNGSRVALVNAFLSNGTHAIKVLLSLAESDSAEKVNARLPQLKSIDIGGHPLTGVASYDPKKLGEDVTNAVFVAENGDRPYVPNVIVVVALAIESKKRDAKYNENFAHSFSGVQATVLAQDFHDPAQLVIYSRMGTSISKSELQDTAGFVKAELRQMISTCKVLNDESVCYYNDTKNAACQRDRIYKMVTDSNPKGYCLNGTGPAMECESEDNCIKACESLQWSKCNCSTESQFRIGNTTTESPEKYFKFCPTRKCTDGCPYGMPGWLIAVIIVVIGILFLVACGICVYCMSQRAKRRRSPPRKYSRSPGRHGQRSRSRGR